jgi:alpha/beta superfamily hydrolase
MPPDPLTCPIGWQPHALAPVFFGMRELQPADGPPTAMRVFFPSLDGAVATAPLLAGCGHYPLVTVVHGHCFNDPDHYRRWFHLPAVLARCGYVVVVPQLAGNEAGTHPSQPDHPDSDTLSEVVDWMRTEWEHAAVLSAGPIGVVGHSFGALVGAQFAASVNAGAFASLSGVWQDWPQGPLPLTLLETAVLLVWGSNPLLDMFTEVSETTWDAMPPPKHRAVWAEAAHWDYLVGSTPPCSNGPGDCSAAGAVTADLVSLFLGKYLPPEFAVHLIDAIPNDLSPPELNLTVEQQFFAGGHLAGFQMLGNLEGNEAQSCALDVSQDAWRYLANRRSRETHSRVQPCPWVSQIAPPNRIFASSRPNGFNWCDYCFPHLADG